MANSLPWDIITNILIRLAVKDLLRYRCTSKSWCSLIDGPDFINLHLKHSLETNSHLSAVFGNACDLYLVDLDAINSTIEFHYLIYVRKGIDMLGGCNGLLALENRAGDLAIINPSTRRYRTCPFLKMCCFLSGVSIRQHVLMGFGYDLLLTDLYDQGFQVEGRNRYLEASFYSVKARTWKEIDGFPDQFNYLYGCGVLVSHTLHWAVTRKSDNSNTIFLFDLMAEDHSELALPAEEGVKNSLLRVVNFDGCLCVSVLPNYIRVVV